MIRYTPLLLALCCACSSPVGKDDGGATEARLPAATEAGLATCADPGQYCTPLDPCGLLPRCSPDHICLAEAQRDCDDGIACTEDRCAPGGCEHLVKAGYCLIDEICHRSGVNIPCGRCDPAASKTAWSPLNGKACDDGNLCTRGDQCKQGSCIGQFYTCSDSLPCTTDTCDGSGGCNHSLKSGNCLIDGACYKQLQPDASGCKICDPGTSAFFWSIRENVCTIAGRCYGAGEQDASGCQECDPLGSPGSWILLPNRCLIGETCLLGGTLHATGCARCDPPTSTSSWSPSPQSTLTATDFSSGLGGWSTSGLVGGVGWQVAGARSSSPPLSLYYGNLATKTYDSGAPNAGTASAPSLDLPAGQKAYLIFQLYLDVDPLKDVDVLLLKVNGMTAWTKNTLTAGDYQRWLPITVDLSAFAGQTVVLTFSFDTVTDANNGGEGVYLDDITFLTGCGQIR